MHMHELLRGRHPLLRAAIGIRMGHLRLWHVRDGLGLAVHARHASMRIHVLRSSAKHRVAWLMRQPMVWRGLLSSLGLRVCKGVQDAGGRALLGHAMWQHLHRAPLLPLHILHDLLRVLWVVPMVRWLLWWRRHVG